MCFVERFTICHLNLPAQTLVLPSPTPKRLKTFALGGLRASPKKLSREVRLMITTWQDTGNSVIACA